MIRWIKIAELDDKTRKVLRDFWKKVWPKEYVDSFLGPEKNKERKIRAHDLVSLQIDGKKIAGKVVNIIGDKATVATDDFIRIVPINSLKRGR